MNLYAWIAHFILIKRSFWSMQAQNIATLLHGMIVCVWGVKPDFIASLCFMYGLNFDLSGKCNPFPYLYLFAEQFSLSTLSSVFNLKGN